MAFDYKKEYREFYMPPQSPCLVEVPPANFLAVRGRGNPNDPKGAYQEAMGLLYGMAFTLKMSGRNGRRIEGFFDYVVPPLEGLWRQEGTEGIDYARKADFQWVSMLRLPDFVTRDDFAWAAAEAGRKKKRDFSSVEFFPYAEGLCVQCMHVGPYDSELATVALLDRFAAEQGLVPDFSAERRHHEIYLSDCRRCAPAKLRTVLRHPVRKR